jgi:hypothetical protein
MTFTYDDLVGLRDTVEVAERDLKAATAAATTAAGALARAEATLAAAAATEAAAQQRLSEVEAARSRRDQLLADAAQADAEIADLDGQAEPLRDEAADIADQLQRPLPPARRAQLLQRVRAIGETLRQIERRRSAAAQRATDARQEAAALEDEVADIPNAQAAHQAAVGEVATALEARDAAQTAATEAEQLRVQAAERHAEAVDTNAAAREGLLGALDPAVPILLTPVRLETRFSLPRADGVRRLRVRVYPDDIHQDAHEPQPTALELASAQEFWASVWRAGRDPEEAARTDAWQALTNRHGAARAAFIAHRVRPTNPDDQPDTAIPTGTALPVDPVLPATTAPAWTRAAGTSILPEHWVAVAFARDGRRIFEFSEPLKLIPRPLALGPDPAEPADPDGDDPTGTQDPRTDAQLAHTAGVSPGMRWMVDFTAAHDSAMAFEVEELKPEDQDIALLLVYGVQATTSPTEAASALCALLDAHAFTGGLDLLAQGTPTNADGPDGAGPLPGVPDAIRWTADGPLAAAGDGSDGDALVTALGLRDRDFTLPRSAHAADSDQRDARDIATVLWPATWGYVLAQMLVPAFDTAPIETWRRYVIDHVRARGPLPTLRIGRQPYGVLPVSSLDVWRGSPEAALHLARLARLREAWRGAVGDVPRIPSEHPRDALLAVLATDALSSTVATRRLFGAQYLRALWRLAGDPLPEESFDQLRAQAGDQLGQLGIDATARIATCAYAEEAVEWNGPWVQAEPVSETDPLVTEYLMRAAVSTPEELHAWTNFPGPPRPLLLVLVRHALLQAYADTAMRLWPLDPPLREPELVDVPDIGFGDPAEPPHTLTSWRYISEPQDGRLLGAAVKRLSDSGDHQAADVTETRQALDRLAQRPSAALERLLSESLDLTTHRLDAWITSLATARLHGMRSGVGAASGLHLGAYGFAEDLAPRDALGQGDLTSGHLHAPSLQQAATAAVLRSGYLTADSANVREALAVDLSSGSVRIAMELIDGIRAGQPLGELLGYRIERALRDHPDTALGLPQYVPALRRLAPLVAGKRVETPSGVDVDAVSARTVCDGLTLVRMAPGALGDPATGLPAPDTEAGEALSAIVADAAQAADALADLAVAETVHQVVQGNPERAGATLEALDRGDIRPFEPDLVRTPRSGTAISHRILVLLGPDNPADPTLEAWRPQHDDAPVSVRAQTEPRINHWAARLLADPSRVIWRARYAGPTPGTGPVVDFTLRALGLAPIDVVYVGGLDRDGDLWVRLLMHATENAPDGVDPTTVELLLDRADAAPDTQLTLPELLAVADTTRSLIAGARVAEAEHLRLPGSRPGHVAAEDLTERLQAARDSVGAALDALRGQFELPDPAAAATTLAKTLAIPSADLVGITNFLDLPTRADALQAADALDFPNADQTGAIRAALLRLAAAGITGAVPRSRGAPAQARSRLAAQAVAIALQAATALDHSDLPDDPEHGFAELFGRDFLILPVFEVPDEATLRAALEHRATAGDATDVEVVPWLENVGLVRAGVGRFTKTLMLAEAVGADMPRTLDIAQLSDAETADDGPWVALPSTERIPAGRLSLGLHFPSGVDTAQPLPKLAGLLVDDWVEVVPEASETTAVTFDVDAPGACAPQALLLAVPPRTGEPWDRPTLEAVLTESIELAHLRAVDPDVLPPLGHLIPALHLAMNVGGDPDGDTISSSFLP